MSIAFYDDHLKLTYASIKRSPIYERVVFHGINCKCCERIRNPVLAIKKKPKRPKKKEVHRI
jgi:hypothetical protein